MVHCLAQYCVISVAFQINEAGERWQKLIKQDWRTSETFNITSNPQTFNVRGFYGNYTINVKQHGTIIKTQTFDVTKDGDNQITITV